MQNLYQSWVMKWSLMHQNIPLFSADSSLKILWDIEYISDDHDVIKICTGTIK